MPDPMSESRVRVLLRIPEKLKEKLTELAEREHRSLNKQIEFLLDRCTREGGTTKQTSQSGYEVRAANGSEGMISTLVF
jgi:hypothetical protein